MPPRAPSSLPRQSWKLALAIIVLASLVVASRSGWLPESERREPAPTSSSPNASETSPPAETQDRTTVVRDVTIHDLAGEVAYAGDVDLQQTLDRIAAGRRLSYRNDGAEFQNRERRLPKKPAGYYREWVHPTPQLDGPGPQRIVTGSGGEIYYTPDHYRTFHRLDRQE